MKETIYYDKTKIMGYNALFNLIMGERGVGKTYGFKLFCTKKCIEEQREFIYLRRYKTEVKSAEMKSFFEDINGLFENKLKVKNNIFYYGDQRIGQAMSLSTYVSNKGINKGKVDYIIYDEFVLDKAGAYRYMTKDFECFLEFYFSISRLTEGEKMRPVYVYFLANTISVNNPFITYYGINLPTDFRGIRKVNDEIVIEISDNKTYQKKIKEQRAFNLIKGTTYADYAFGAKYLRDDDTFIERKKGKGWDYWFTLGAAGKKYGVYINYSQNKINISAKADKNYPRLYTFTLDDHSPNALLIHTAKQEPIIRKFKWAFENGIVSFENQAVKNVCYNIKSILT